jgi:fructokinase
LIVVCGEALVDLVEGADGLLKPVPGGGPFNTARTLARLGAPVAFLGRLSTDAFGQWLAATLDEDGVDLSLVSRGDEPTTLAVARLGAGHDARYDFYHLGTSAPSLAPAMLPERLGSDVDALHVGSLGLVLEPMASTLFDLMRRETDRLPIMLDPNVRPAVASSADAYRSRLKSALRLSAIVKASREDVR